MRPSRADIDRHRGSRQGSPLKSQPTNQPTNLGEETGWEIGGGGLPPHACHSFVESHGSLEQDGLPFSQRYPITRAGEEGTDEEGTGEGHEIHSARRAARLFYAHSPSVFAEILRTVS